jgi:hypothetical protein
MAAAAATAGTQAGELASSSSAELVARTGRERQRYEQTGARLVAGCAPRAALRRALRRPGTQRNAFRFCTLVC